MLYRRNIFVICISIIFFCCFLYGEGNYWGATGLIRIPNGRIIEDGNLRLSISHGYPYRTYSATFGFLPFLELNGRITELLDQKVHRTGWEDYGYYKDKAADFKLLVFSERGWMPSISIGAQDFHGTQLFFNEYVAASKRIKNLDFTVGYGGNLFGSLFKEDGTQTRELDGTFGGVEWRIIPNVSIICEYDPTERLARNSTEKIDSHYNFGVRWNPLRWLNLTYAFQKGNEHSVCLAITYPFGSPLLEQRNDEPFYGPVNRTPLIYSLSENSTATRLSKIRDYICDEGLTNVKVTLSKDRKDLYVEYENKKYLSQVKGLGRVLRICAAQSPSDIDKIHIIVKSNDIPMIEVSLYPNDFIDFLNGKISAEEVLSRMEITSAVSEYNNLQDIGLISSSSEKTSTFSYSIKPVDVESYWNDPSGFYKARIGPTFSLDKNFGRGLSAESYIKVPFFNNIETDLPPISDEPIRSDIADYLENNGVIVEDLFLNKFAKVGDTSFCKFTAGYLELQFAGVSAEYLKIFKGGRLGLGTEISWAKKRESDSPFGLKDFDAVTPFLNGYIYVPELDTTVQASIGKFLAGDKGMKFQVTRYVRGGSIFVWYTKTDTDDFTGPNRNYSDKGIGFSLPIRVFENHDRQGVYNYAISPWSRDVGQQVGQPYSLYDFVFKFTPAYFVSHWREITE